VYLDKRVEAVIAMFGAAAAGGVFVPLNPVLKPLQIPIRPARLCGASARDVERPPGAPRRGARDCDDLLHVVIVDADTVPKSGQRYAMHRWEDPKRIRIGPSRHRYRHGGDPLHVGSTGQPKGVVLSHRNLVAGAKSVASYLETIRGTCFSRHFRLSFDAGFSQLTTAFHAGARVCFSTICCPRTS
jgi:acyl-CoA synthetase (AMP-forming)/AMP-acid ligase II